MILRLFNQYPDWSFLDNALLCFRADSLRTIRMHDCARVNAASRHRCIYSVLTRLVPQETAAVSVYALCTPYNHAPVCLSLQFYSKTHTKGDCVFSCNLPAALWQNDRDLYRATAVYLYQKEKKNIYTSNLSSSGHKTNSKHWFTTPFFNYCRI